MRKQRSLKNLITSVIPYFILTILGFLRLKVLLQQLGTEIYALNQVFINIFAYISLAEAGIGTLITQLYYKYFVEDDKENIKEVFSASKKILMIISLIMILGGFLISFALKLLTQNSLSLVYMQLVFMLYLFRSVMEYIMFAPRFVLMADQKSYKINLIINFYKIIEIIAEVIILQFYQNYAVILCSSILIRFISYYIANKVTFKEYPWLHTVKTDRKIRGMKNVIAHKIAGVVYSNTDILLASSFLTPMKVTIYSSYNYIIKFINDIVYMFATSITASMGNVLYKEEVSKQEEVFEEINSIFIFFAMLLTIALYFSINKFVGLWIGTDKIINKLALIFMLATLYTSITIRPFLIIRDAMALYKESKGIAIMEGIINFVLSLVLIQKFDLVGLVFSTLFATFVTSNIFYPIKIYKKIFNKSAIKYFAKFFMSAMVCILLCYITDKIYSLSCVRGYLEWLTYSTIYFITVFSLVFVINYAASKHFRNFINETIRNIILKIRCKNEKSN